MNAAAPLADDGVPLVGGAGPPDTVMLTFLGAVVGICDFALGDSFGSFAAIRFPPAATACRANEFISCAEIFLSRLPLAAI